MPRPLTALGIDIFGGLFTRGVVDAGFQVHTHLEHGPYGVETAKLNFPGLEVYEHPSQWDPHRFAGKIDFVFANPPCAAWSSMGKGGKENWRLQTDRLQCVRDVAAAGMIIRPKAWCWESVLGAWRNGKELVFEVARQWNEQGYNCTIWLQNNCWLGVPQSRERMFLIAHKHPLVWPPFTDATTVKQALKRASKKPHPTAPRPGPIRELDVELWKRSETLKGRLRDAYTLMTRDELAQFRGGAPLAVTKRLDPDRPAPVMLASFTRLHPTEPRMLTYNEWLALVGLPETWQTSQRGFDAATRELARAVMPGVGKFLATAVRDGLELPPLRHVETRLVDHRNAGNAQLHEELLWRCEYKPNKAPKPDVVWAPPPAPEPKVRSARAPREGGTRVGPMGIGKRIRDLLELGEGTQDILRIIHDEFPHSKATAADVSWNRRKLRLMKES